MGTSSNNPYHERRGRQFICYTCNCRPCHEDCPTQFYPDTLVLRAKRARMTAEEWAAAHPEWMEKYGYRQDVKAFLLEKIGP